MRFIIPIIFSICLVSSALSQEAGIIPKPVSKIQPAVPGLFPVNVNTVIVLEGSGLDKSAAYLNEYLQQFYKIKLKIVRKSTNKNSIRLNFTRLDHPIPGAYQLKVDGNGVRIEGDNEQGVFYGLQSLIQLLTLPGEKKQPALPYISIEDSPGFAYRGMHLDVARHFFPVSFIKKYIDYLAYHKFNKFHWHLTDDQGWRIEIKKYPLLTILGASRNGTIIGRYPGIGNINQEYGGFYTQQQIREVVRYAKDRYIDIVPEIEMPGHGSAAIAAYPGLSCFPEQPTMIPANMISRKSVQQQEQGRIKLVQETWGVFDDVFCAGKDSTFVFLQNVMDEVINLFPSKYVHIGGDECPKTHWKKCPACQKRMKDEGLKDEHALQSYFVQRMEKHVNAKGRTIIGWDEILEGGLAPNAVVMSWRGEKGGIEAAKQAHSVIMTPGSPFYFDHSQTTREDSVTIGGHNPIEAVYAYDPIPTELTEEESGYILGAQANLWTEYITNSKKIEYMVFPRMSALSEVLWSPKKDRNWEDFSARLENQFKHYDLWKANYSQAFFDLKASIEPGENNDGVLWKIESRHTGDSILFQDAYPLDCPNKKTGVVDTIANNDRIELPSNKSLPFKKRINCSGKYSYRLIKAGMETPLIEQDFYINKATGKKIRGLTEVSKKYPGDGAFTLVNGVQNELGLARTKEFIGYEGVDASFIIDMGKDIEFNEIIVHAFHQPASWIYSPAGLDISASADGINFSPLPEQPVITRSADKKRLTVSFPVSQKVYQLKVTVLNHGEISAGNPGAGNKAWLFLDEIEVK